MHKILLSTFATAALLVQSVWSGPGFAGDDLNVIQVHASKPIVGASTDGHPTLAETYTVTLGGVDYKVVSSERLIDETSALQSFVSRNKHMLEQMSKYSGFETLTSENAEEYASNIIPVITSSESSEAPISDLDRHYAKSILDMCFLLMGEANTSSLRISLDKLNNLHTSSPNFQSILDDISQYAPSLAGDNSNFVRDAMTYATSTEAQPLSMTPDIGGSGSFSLSNANQYAQRWAYSPNPRYNYYEGRDCANFVSQIMKAGGYTENSSWSYNNGNPTRSWTVANDFANKFGLTRRTTSLTTFTSRAVVGRPIGLYSGSTTYHVAYVASKGSPVSYQGQSYRPLTIAQHSRNYYGSMNGGAASAWRDQGAWVTP